jgi:hypothetical protein
VVDGPQFAWQVPILRSVMIQGLLVNFAFSGVARRPFDVVTGRHGTRSLSHVLSILTGGHSSR